MAKQRSHDPTEVTWPTPSPSKHKRRSFWFDLSDDVVWNITVDENGNIQNNFLNYVKTFLCSLVIFLWLFWERVDAIRRKFKHFHQINSNVAKRLETLEPYQRHHTEKIQSYLATSTSCLSQPCEAVITRQDWFAPTQKMETQHFLFCNIKKKKCSKFAGELDGNMATDWNKMFNSLISLGRCCLAQLLAC